MTTPDKPDSFEKITDDLNVTRRLGRFLADNVPNAAELTPGNGGDPNLLCVFGLIADRLGSIEDRLEAELSERQRGPRLVK